uniref:Uncharacterized protein n=1 Tax=Arundo donax TaxID=35708 RepID=A0A0A9BFA8_ARUDO
MAKVKPCILWACTKAPAHPHGQQGRGLVSQFRR